MASALLILLLWWQKPTGVSARIRLYCPAATDNIVEEMLDSTKNDRVALVTHLRTQTIQADGYDLDYDWNAALTFFIFIGFGAWHVAVWNYSFPTKMECILWRVSSIGAMVMQVLVLLLSSLEEVHLQGEWAALMGVSVAGVYVVLRTYIMVETIISLRSAPAGIYQQVGWSTFAPHI